MSKNPEVVDGLSDADWSALEKEAGSVTLRYLRTDDPSLEKRVKVATTVLSAATRRQASAGARDALNFAISRSIARTPEEMAEYIRLTQPSFPTLPSTVLPSTARQGNAGQGNAKQGKALTDGEGA